MNALQLKTAASCEEHGERTYNCVNCGQQATRKACETWHLDQCDDCIDMWGYDKAVKDADKAINDGAHKSVIDWHTQNVERWRKSVEARGLIERRKKFSNVTGDQG